MHIFGAAGVRLGVLRPEHIHRLTVNSRGSKEVREAVKGFGGMGGSWAPGGWCWAELGHQNLRCRS